MRISDDRYTRDRLRLDIALRLIRHEARTLTIREWTGLSDDRIRKLYRTYVENTGTRRVLRHRGKSPRQPAYFFRTAERSFHAAQLASLFVVFGLLQGSSSGLVSICEPGSFDACSRLCSAYETYIHLHAPERLSFEHAWFLFLALSRRREMALSECTNCQGVKLRDLMSRRTACCGNCAN
jgi:Flagellar transcriptional activator (FlhC)